MRANTPLSTVLAALLVALASTGCETIASADPNALWDIVHFDCVPAARDTSKTGLCASVDLKQRFALLKDRNGAAQHLLIPTDRVTGIESPLLLGPDAPNYWTDAWTARSFVEASIKKPLPDNLIGLEVNSKYRRSQEQLHIHIDCMHAEASAALEHHRGDPPGQWTWDTIGGSRYRIMRVASPAFDFDPFDIVARDRSGAAEMAMQTILVTGAGPQAANDGWLILNSGTDIDGGSGSAEPLLDHACAIAHN
ncbi:CDP-diacylglycerol diphosphatase [Trinickia terrae]|uniref:CDP-diacylglycerol pyrophosphatase n=1 Tax=Trinickia terrae TaxID=2571161 RepID=A0A4U1HJ83_9BURK|nr:CDP-diacylglycerol diphosphatase [Trinickia terrae]TKC81235.1 CDP-diacylglycerol diphosphatase [Trinickia terrae]